MQDINNAVPTFDFLEISCGASSRSSNAHEIGLNSSAERRDPRKQPTALTATQSILPKRAPLMVTGTPLALCSFAITIVVTFFLVLAGHECEQAPVEIARLVLPVRAREVVAVHAVDVPAALLKAP